MKTMRIFFAAVLMTLGMTTAQAQHCCEGGNATVEKIMTRTSIRKYQDRAIEAGKIDTLVRATENLLLAAHALGLGAVWTGGYPRMERCANIAAVIGTPEYIVPLCVVYVGYPAEQPAPKQKFKTENVSWNAYGNANRE